MVKTLDNKLKAKIKPIRTVKRIENLGKFVAPNYFCFGEPDNKEATNSEVTVTQRGGIIGALEEVASYFNPMCPGVNFYKKK